MPDRTYIAIDLKSFYASVECADRRLDPLATNLVVADESRTEKTICLAVSPSLKACGIPGRARLFEVVQKVREANAIRQRNAPYRRFTGKSCNAPELAANPALELGYIVAPPRMARYMEVSQNIFSIYMRHVSPDDIHVYSIDEVFINATQYLRMYGLTAHEFTMRLIQSVLKETGITATAGIGTNLYLAKVAMDIVAKHIPADRDGVRIAELDETSYRRSLWTHRPLTDFWRVGHGYADKLEEHGMRTMGDVARRSMTDEATLYRLFGVNAELLIDHAWGWEPCTIAEIKAYRPASNSISVGQVLQDPYPYDKGRLVVKEMADSLSLDLVEKRLVTDQMVLTVGYDVENLKDGRTYGGPVETDRYGRSIPKEAHGSINLEHRTSSSKTIVEAVARLYDRIVNPKLLVRRMYVVASRVVDETTAQSQTKPEQLDLFTDYKALEEQRAKEQADAERERKAQEALLAIRQKLGKNAILKGMNLEDGATARDRNRQIGGHKA
jgi:DNA polymerase V